MVNCPIGNFKSVAMLSENSNFASFVCLCSDCQVWVQGASRYAKVHVFMSNRFISLLTILALVFRKIVQNTGMSKRKHDKAESKAHARRPPFCTTSNGLSSYMCASPPCQQSHTSQDIVSVYSHDNLLIHCVLKTPCVCPPVQALKRSALVIAGFNTAGFAVTAVTRSHKITDLTVRPIYLLCPATSSLLTQVPVKWPAFPLAAYLAGPSHSNMRAAKSTCWIMSNGCFMQQEVPTCLLLCVCPSAYRQLLLCSAHTL